MSQLGLSFCAIVASLFSPKRFRALSTGIFVSGIGISGAITGGLAVWGNQGSLSFTVSIPHELIEFSPTPLGGLFMLVVGVVGAICAIYAIGYAHEASESRTAWIAMAIFLLAMQLVTASADVLSFLFTWELMAISSIFLILSDYAVRESVREATMWYIAMTQLSFSFLLIGFSILTSIAGSTRFSDFTKMNWSSTRVSFAFVMLVLGFAAKAGIVPLHVWLPRAHPEAPSHISALMSAAMVKMGVYGMLLVSTQFLVHGPIWWSVGVCALGIISAIYGILQASVSSDLKKLLAYSTTENVGLMFLAIGSVSLLRAYGMYKIADIALVASLLLVIAHAAFKTTLFLGAGSILQATGDRDLDNLGGLGTRMPFTSIFFGLGALGAAALPWTIGFTAEWVLLQALIHGASQDNRVLAMLVPIEIGAVALTTGLALMTFVKAFGTAFLSRPRGDGAEKAVESPPSMVLGMAIAALFVVGLGLVPGVSALLAVHASGISLVGHSGLFGIDLESINAQLSPLWLAILACAIVLPLLLGSLRYSRIRARRFVNLAWGGGGARQTRRMQYTATSYAEPLSRIFDDSLRPERDVIVTHSTEARYLVERIQYRQNVVDIFELRFYQPIIRFAERLSFIMRRLQNGKIHFYLTYSFLALLAVLIVVSV